MCQNQLGPLTSLHEASASNPRAPFVSCSCCCWCAPVTKSTHPLLWAGWMPRTQKPNGGRDWAPLLPGYPVPGSVGGLQDVPIR